MTVDPAQVVQEAELGRGRLRVGIAGLEPIDRGLDLRPEASDEARSLCPVLPSVVEGRKAATFETGPCGSLMRGGLPVNLVIERRVQVLPQPVGNGTMRNHGLVKVLCQATAHSVAEHISAGHIAEGLERISRSWTNMMVLNMMVLAQGV